MRAFLIIAAVLFLIVGVYDALFLPGGIRELVVALWSGFSMVSMGFAAILARLDQKLVASPSAAVDARPDVLVFAPEDAGSGGTTPARPSFWGDETPTDLAPRGHGDRVTAGVFALLLGGFGIHKFYLGETRTGMIYFAFFWTLVPTVLGLVDGAYLLSMDDAEFAVRYP